MVPVELVSAQDASSNITSNALDLGDLQVFSIHANFTGATLAGTLALEASNDNTDFAAISGASQVVASAASHVFNVVNAAYRYVRLTWTQTGGTGNLTVKALIKENPIKGA